MIRADDTTGSKLDLATANILVVSDRESELDMLAQMLKGFGVPDIQRCAGADDAIEAAANNAFDLALIDAALKPAGGCELVRTLRRRPQAFAKTLPIILICGHVRLSDVFNARDCGASAMLSKPVSPQILFNRLVFLARDQRQFVESDSYVGPDRRFKAYGPPAGMAGRRHDDLSAKIGQAKEANLSQDMVDGFFGAQKASL